MATVPQKLTIEEFERLYGDRKPRYEYWFGEAIAKAMPTWLHGMLQFLVMRLLRDIGYRGVASEVKIKLASDAHPLPDVIATSGRIELPYPTQPFDVAIEILSPSDTARDLFRRCRYFAEWGIRHIYVLDPEERTAQRWSAAHHALEDVEQLEFEGKPNIPVQRLWDELDCEVREAADQP